MTQWRIFSGESEPSDTSFPEAPPWRRFARPADDKFNSVGDIDYSARYWARARTYQTPKDILDAVNAALVLRRPLLVTGPPGTGKSSLIYRVAYELKLGPVLVWPVNSRSTLDNGLYDYDAIGRLRDKEAHADTAVDIGEYIRLRALGTALLPSERPRALLIDELDKADPDLPNDLLNALEEGWFEIPELQRQKNREVAVRIASSAGDAEASAATAAMATITEGRVQCYEFPFIVLTSNDEREFPAAFLRRCIRVELKAPDVEQLAQIVGAHVGPEVAERAQAYIERFASSNQPRATDQLLNAAYLVHRVSGGEPEDSQRLYEMLTNPSS
ncbi:AAA domain protein [compost metagenome]